MKTASYYQKNLETQCDSIIRIFNGEKDNGLCKKRFNSVCQNLASDFLPPIDREDIAVLSLKLLNIFNRTSIYYEMNSSLQKEELLVQLGYIKQIVTELFGKRKTCGEIIRRQIEKNLVCENLIVKSKSVDRECALALNRSIGEFLKYSLSAYFKNL